MAPDNQSPGNDTNSTESRWDWVQSPILAGELRGARWSISSGGKIARILLGSYEREQTEHVRRLVQPGDTFVDIGANSGYYTLLASRLVGAGGRVVACEPEPRNAYFLHKHIARNRAANVTLLQTAVGGRNGFLQFARGTGTGTGRLAEGGELRVEVQTLDSLVTQYQLCPTHLKIDVEGAEAEVLRGGEQTLRAHAPTILLSTHGEPVKEECAQLLSSWGYEFLPIETTSIETAAEMLCRAA